MSFMLQRGWFAALCALAVLARVVLTATTFGTNDAIFWSDWVSMVERFGIIGTYQLKTMVNHPPPALLLASGVAGLARRLDLQFVDLFRAVQIAADVAAAAALYRIGRAESVEYGRALALFILLSPAAAFVSGFHCNTDPLMIALTVVAASLGGSTARSAAAMGATLALACSIKIVPLLLLPLFFISVSRPVRTRFALAFGLVMAAGFLPALAAGGPLVMRRIFGYAGGLPHEWGITGMAFAISRNFRSAGAAANTVFATYTEYGRWVVYAGLAVAIALLLRRGVSGTPELLRSSGVVILVLLALAPGFGVQWMAWLIPLLPFVLPWRGAIAVNAAASVFLFVTYTVWSGGWPWTFADLARPGPYRFLGALAGDAMWVVVCLALVEAVRRLQRMEPARNRMLNSH